MDDLATRLLVKVAQLYHLQGLNQDQIGRQIGVSRSKVSRMLKEARERGLVEISIHYPARFALDLERRLESELGLREAVVVNAGAGIGMSARAAVAGAACDYLLRVLQPGDVLGVSGGETLTLVGQVLPTATVENVSVVQLGTAVPYLGDGAAYSSAEVALQIAQKLGSIHRLVMIPVPSLLDNESIRDALLRDTGVRRAMSALASCTIAAVGIGAMESGSRAQGLPVGEADIARLRDVGAVGEICARFFAVNGEPCTTALDRRMVALDLAQLRSVPLVIGVAAGTQKAQAILGAVRGGYVKSLVTDRATAIEILRLAGSAPRGEDAWIRGGVGIPAGR